MLNTLQDAELPLRGARETVTRLGCCGARVGIDAHAARDVGRSVPRGEVLPVLALAQELAELIVTDPASATRRADPSLLDRAYDGPGCPRIRCTTAPEPQIVRTQQDFDDARVVGCARVALKDDALLGAGV